MTTEKAPIYDCVIIGAGPGGIQAAIYLARYRRRVILLDKGGGRTWHARHIENYLTQPAISGAELIEKGLAQARHFGVEIIKTAVTQVTRREHFETRTGEETYASRFVIAATGGRENLPEIENIGRFFGTSFFTCVDCDGYRTTGKRLVIIGNSINTVRLAFAMKEMYTDFVTLNLVMFDPPDSHREALAEEGIGVVKGRPLRIVGEDNIEALEMRDGTRIECDVILSNFGYKLNDEYLQSFSLDRDAHDFKIAVNHHFETSVKGLFAIGALNTGHGQAIISAGEGAAAAIEINRRLLNL